VHDGNQAGYGTITCLFMEVQLSQEVTMHYLKSFCFLLVMLMSVSTYAGPVDINTADVDTIAAAINGVGDKKAAAIVQYRDVHGPFASIDELADVKGIGMRTVDKNRENLTVSPPATQ
jgi:competence protein ComEA